MALNGESRPAGAAAPWSAVLGMFVLLSAATYAALIAAPTERTMGLIQRIFYFHMPSGITSFVAFAIVLVASIAYLRTRRRKWDWLAVSAAEVGLAFISVVLVTGPIWAHPVWGIWWTWDAKLTSAFVLWLLYVSYLVLRSLVEDPERRAVVSAVFGIFAALDVPLVYFANWLFPTQHPKPVVGPGGSLDPRMGWVLLVCWLALLSVMAILIRLRYRVEALRVEVEELRIAGHAAGS